MKSIKYALSLLAVAFLAHDAWAEKISKHTVDDWDEWYWQSSVSVARGEAHTFWIKGLTENTCVGSLSVYYSYTYTEDGEKWTDEYRASVFWEGSDASGSCDQYVLLTTDDWADIPGSGSVKFTVYVDGSEPDTESEDYSTADISFTFGHAKGAPQGLESNPYAISSVSTDEGSAKGTTVMDNECYFRVASLEQGVLYKFWTTGGSSANGFEISADSDEDVASPDTKDLVSEELGEYDDGICVIPSETGAHVICVSGEEYGGTVTLHYQKVGSRTPAKHTATDLGTPVTSEAVSAKCVPERRNNLTSGYYDEVIDDDLFKVTLKKGKYYKFWTDGATADLVMELYDKSGNKLVVNRKGFATGDDCLFVYKAAASADYWVGVCQDLQNDETSELASVSCRLYAQQITKGQLDDWDNGDDVYTGASVLVPALANSWKKGQLHGPHTLGATDWADWFSIACRAGATYKIGAQLTEDEEEESNLVLKATVYTITAKGKKTVVATFPDLIKGNDGKAWTFTPTANGTHYVEVTLTGCQGSDFGPYEIGCSVTQEDVDFGYLQVDVGGATIAEGAGWYLKGEADAVYAPGTVALPAGEYKVYFTDVTGWSTPSGKTVTVAEGETTVVSRKYSDTCDHDDDVYSGAVKIAPTTEGVTYSRSLWTDDPADWMRFTSVSNVYYTFRLTGDEAKLGDAKITVYEKDRQTVVAEGTDLTFIIREGKLKYYVVVSHADDSARQDSQYVLSASYKQVGAIGFASTVYSVADSKASVTLKVTRTGGTTGKVSASCSTVTEPLVGTTEGVAQPGDDYVPMSTVLTWGNGESDTKTVTIDLLPKLRDVYKGDRTFSVKLDLTDTPEEELGDDEYRPIIATALADVTITDASKMATGTLQFAGTSDEWEDAPTSVKSSASVKAGERLKLWFSRTGGTQGQVGLKVNTKDSTAKYGTNYERIKNKVVRWADGSSDLQYVLLETKDLETAYQEALKLTVSAALDGTSAAAATLGSFKTLTVTIVDPLATQTFATYQAACKKRDGIRVAATGTWFFDENGCLRNVTPEKKGATATLTATLTGPGKFAFSPTFENGGSAKKGTATYSVDGGKAVACGDDDVELSFSDAKAHTVVFTVTRKQSSVSGDVTLGFTEREDGQPFLWVPLRAPAIVSPLSVEALGTTPTLRWADAGEGVTYVLNVNGTKASYLGKKSGSVVRNLALAETSYAFAEGQLVRGKTYYARVDAVMTTDDGSRLTATGTVFTFTTAGESVAGSGTLKTLFADGAVDAWGEPVAEPEDAGMPYEVALVQGVDIGASFGLSYSNKTGGSVSYAVVDAKNYPLPAGLTLKSGKITGYPTTVGSFTTILQATQTKSKVKTPGETLKVTFNVASQGVAAGTFNGLVTTEDERIADDVTGGLAASTLASVAITVRTTPKADYAKNISATVRIGGGSCVFTAPCWSRTETVLEDGLPGAVLELSCVTNVYRKPNKAPITVTNRLTLVTTLADAGEEGALDRPMDVTLEMTLPTADKLSWATNVVWAGQALRKNTGVASVKAAIAPFAGYYTVALAPSSLIVGDNAGKTGNGYLTMQVTSGGSVSYAGVLGDGETAFSGSALCNLRRGVGSDESDEVVIPVYCGTSETAFGGWLRLRMDGSLDWKTERLLESATVPVVCADTLDESCAGPLTWISADADESWSGDGFATSVEPVGGYYDTTANLQRYYYDLREGLAISADTFESFANDFLAPLLGDTYVLLAWPGMESETERTDLNVAGNSVTASTKKWVYRDGTKMIDWSASTNPCNLKFNFTRANGIYTGTANLFKGDAEAGAETVRKTLSTVTFQGVLLFSSDPASTALEYDVLAPGSLCSATQTDEETPRNVTVSVPFAVRAVEKVEPWQEGAGADE